MMSIYTCIYITRKCQHWVKEGEFYIDSFVLLNSYPSSHLRLCIVRFIFALHRKYDSGRIFRYMQKHLEHLWNKCGLKYITNFVTVIPDINAWLK